MKVVVSVQAKRSSSRGLVHYIATSKIDPDREVAGRSLFIEQADGVSVEKANALLSPDISRKRAPNEDLHHLVLSIKREDFDRLGATDKARGEGLRDIAREAMKALAEEIGADALRWAGAVHLNTENPHVHLAIHKDYFDRELERRRLSKIPVRLLPRREKNEPGGGGGGEKHLVEGRLAEAAKERLESIARSVAMAVGRESGERRPAAPSQAEERSQADSFEKESAILARALVAKHHLSEAEHKLGSIKRDGCFLRFKVADSSAGKLRPRRRFASLSELESERLSGLTAPKLSAEEKKAIAVPSESENRIKAILRKMIVLGTREVEARQKDYGEVAPAVEKLRKEARRSGQKMPLPAFASGRLDEIQSAAIDRGDFRMAGYLERVRLELAARDRLPSRTDEEVGRLKGRAATARLAVLLAQKEREELAARGSHHRVETSAGRLSLSDAGRLAAEVKEADKGAVGSIVRIAHKLAGRPSEQRQVLLKAIRTEVRAVLKARDAELAASIALEHKRAGFLDRMLAKDTNPDKDTIPELLTPAELAAAEQIGRQLLLPDVVRQSWEGQKSMFASLHNGRTTDVIIAGRIVARKIVSDADLAKSKERVEAFGKNGHFEKFPVLPKGANPGDRQQAEFLSLHDIGIRPNASVLDQALDFFIEGSEARRARRQIEAAIKARRAELNSELVRTAEITRDADKEAAPFVQGRILRDPKLLADPVFTRSEAARLERRAAETENARESLFIRKVLDDPNTRVVRDLETLLDVGRGRGDDAAERNQRQNARSPESPVRSDAPNQSRQSDQTR